ncbi:MAG: Asp-tRNA(Asn)/Glu-tRNA(Gln) amidotransferase subunit GatA, partial [Verrucomicrobiota bacterium]|nr:Asp-tRNA(Asn)/Glu-tRNA(Gln) amidotransferase subunit GatA [Verrucomicrobiota bacterium]
MTISTEWMTMRDVSTAIRGGELSCREAVEALLERIERFDGRINAYLDTTAEAALARADAMDRGARGEGRLWGVPIGIKDVIAVEGAPCRCGSRMLDRFLSPYDGTVVRKLKDAGSIPMGRLNMDEFAMGSTNENSGFGPVCNPWDPAYVSGGSSGGSAAAVASGMAYGALGSDTGGSIRQPASLCGVVGLKPTYGSVSRFGLVAYASSLDQIGPITRDVTDAALLFDVICGHDPQDATSLQRQTPATSAGLEGGVKGMRIGLPREYFTAGLDPEVEAAVRRGVETLQGLGAEVEEVSLPHTEYAVATYYILATAEASANLARFDGVRYGHRCSEPEDVTDLYFRSRAEGFGSEVKRRIILGTYVLSSGYYDAYYLRAQKARTLIRRDFEKAFERVDLLAAAVSPTPAYALGACVDDPLQMYLGDILTVPMNLAGNCGISVPCGLTAGGLPIGLQLMGPPFAEAELLRAARAFEAETPWHRKQPDMAVLE